MYFPYSFHKIIFVLLLGKRRKESKDMRGGTIATCRNTFKQRELFSTLLLLREAETRSEKYKCKVETNRANRLRRDVQRRLFDVRSKVCLAARDLLVSSKSGVMHENDMRAHGVMFRTTTEKSMRDFCPLLVRVYPGWYAARERVTSFRCIDDILEQVERDARNGYQKRIMVIESPCIPHLPQTYQLNHLKAFEMARVALLGAWIENRNPSESVRKLAARRLGLNIICT